MAKEYLEKLSKLIKELNLDDEIVLPLEVTHFFSGAALYVNGTICASWSPVGLAFKLPDQEVERLISDGFYNIIFFEMPCWKCQKMSRDNQTSLQQNRQDVVCLIWLRLLFSLSPFTNLMDCPSFA